MDIELAVDAMELAGHIDHMVLFSGDGDFRSLVEAVQRRGVRVSVVSTTSTQPPMIADELRRQADQFVDIVELQPKISRDPSEPAARETRELRHLLQRGTTQQGVSGLPTFRPSKLSPRIHFRRHWRSAPAQRRENRRGNPVPPRQARNGRFF